MGNEVKLGQSPETVSPYAEVGNADLIVKFYEMGTDPDIGRELSVRLLTHAGYIGDPTIEPLIDRDGRQIQDSETGRQFTLVDYVNYATEHHSYALQRILNFLYTKPGEPDYEEGRAVYALYLEAGRRQAGEGL